MKHWDGRDRDDAGELRLSPLDHARLAPFVGRTVDRREPTLPLVLGLAFSFILVFGLFWALSPVGPVDPAVMP